jgi:phosphatidylglycerol:prolipoprotein diacylglycerol transferase
MHQVLIEFKSISILSIYVFITLGLFISLWVLGKLAQKNRLRLQFILDIGIRLIIGALIGGRIIAIIENYQFYFNRFNTYSFLKLFAVWDKDLAFWGVILGIGFVLVKNCQARNENIKKWADISIISLMVMLTFRNFGVFLDGSNGGKPTEFFTGMTFNSSNVIYTVPIHPTQLYATIYTGLLAFLLYFLFKKYKNQFEGLIFLVGATLLSSLRFLEGFLRGDDVLSLFRLRVPQLLSLILAIYFSKKLYNYQVQNKVPFLNWYEKTYTTIIQTFKKPFKKK